MIYQDQIVPIFNLTEGIHSLLFWFLFPLFGSIITVLLFSRILTPLILKIKRRIFIHFDDKYLDRDSVAFNRRVFVFRAIYIVLLTMGMMSFILPLIDTKTLMPEYLYEYFISEGIIPTYGLAVIWSVLGMILPFVVGLWSISWAMEDAGLMHHRLEDRRPGKLYEIEPIHIKYNSYLKGYAGITAILFIVQISIHYTQVPYRQGEVIGAFIVPLFSIAYSAPAYYIYAKVMGNNSYLRKGLTQIKNLSIKDVSKD